MFSSRKIKIIAFAIGLLAVIAALAYFLSLRPSANNKNAVPSPLATRMSAPLAVTVPEPGMQNVPANIAVPEREVPVAPGAEEQYRIFAIRARNEAFSPNTVIAKRGDVIHITINAIDHAYDFTQPDYGFNVLIQKGQIKTIEFNASAAGQFSFFCKSCAAEGAAVLGTIIIVEP